MARCKHPAPFVRGTLPLTAASRCRSACPVFCGLQETRRRSLGADDSEGPIVNAKQSIALVLPAAGPGRAAAACTVDPDFLDGVGSGCARCSADGSKCEECVERYGLKQDGTCVPCQPVRVGKLLEEDAPVFW